jgi:hypothetical protein
VQTAGVADAFQHRPRRCSNNNKLSLSMTTDLADDVTAAKLERSNYHWKRFDQPRSRTCLPLAVGLRYVLTSRMPTQHDYFAQYPRIAPRPFSCALGTRFVNFGRMWLDAPIARNLRLEPRARSSEATDEASCYVRSIGNRPTPEAICRHRVFPGKVDM